MIINRVFLSSGYSRRCRTRLFPAIQYPTARRLADVRLPFPQRLSRVSHSNPIPRIWRTMAIASAASEAITDLLTAFYSWYISLMPTPEITAYLKTYCGWSAGVRAVLTKYDLRYLEKDIIQNPAFRCGWPLLVSISQRNAGFWTSSRIRRFAGRWKPRVASRFRPVLKLM